MGFEPIRSKRSADFKSAVAAITPHRHIMSKVDNLLYSLSEYPYWFSDITYIYTGADGWIQSDVWCEYLITYV